MTELKNRLDAALGVVTARLAAWHITATMLAAGGFASALAAFYAIAWRDYWLGLGCIELNLLFAFFEHALARRAPGSAFGQLLTSLFPLAGRSLIPLGFALADPPRALAATLLIVSLNTFFFAAAITLPAVSHLPRRLYAALLTTALMFACVFPELFSLFAYGLSIAAFAGIGWLLARARAAGA